MPRVLGIRDRRDRRGEVAAAGIVLDVAAEPTSDLEGLRNFDDIAVRHVDHSLSIGLMVVLSRSLGYLGDTSPSNYLRACSRWQPSPRRKAGADESTAFWRAVAQVHLDRPAGLGRARSIVRGRHACLSDLRGPMRGHFITSTVNRPIDVAMHAFTSSWLPWKGKTFDPASSSGRNLFTAGAKRMMRVTLPRYRLVDEAGGLHSAFRFVTSTGPSAFTPGVEVLRIDYRDVAENPRWPIRKVLDELVQIDDTHYLGQALLEFRGSLRRAAWFALEPARSARQASGVVVEHDPIGSRPRLAGEHEPGLDLGAGECVAVMHLDAALDHLGPAGAAHPVRASIRDVGPHGHRHMQHVATGRHGHRR